MILVIKSTIMENGTRHRIKFF